MIEIDFWDWYDLGKERGWISEAWCVSHDSPPLTTDEEDLDFDDIVDLCIPVVRVWGHEIVF